LAAPSYILRVYLARIEWLTLLSVLRYFRVDNVSTILLYDKEQDANKEQKLVRRVYFQHSGRI